MLIMLSTITQHACLFRTNPQHSLDVMGLIVCVRTALYGCIVLLLCAGTEQWL